MEGFLRPMLYTGKDYYQSFEDVAIISLALPDLGSLDYPVTQAHPSKLSTDWNLLAKEIGRSC